MRPSHPSSVSLLLPLFLPVLLLCGTTSAQTTTSAVLQTMTPAGVHVLDENGSQLHSVKAGTKIAPDLSLQASTPGGVSASSRAQVFGSGGLVIMTVTDRGSASVSTAKGKARFGNTASTDPKSVTPGPYAMRLDIPLPRGAAGKLRVRYSGKMSGNVQGVVTVDIGANGQIDFREKAAATVVEKNFTVRAGVSGLSVIIRTDSQGSIQGKGSASYDTNLVITYFPQSGCTFTPYGKTCGPLLAGSSIPTPGGPIVMLNLKNAPKSGPVWLALGFKTANISIPGITCPLIVDPLAVTVWNANQKGELKMVLGAGPTTPFEFRAQVFAQDRGTSKVSGSNGLRGACR
jgi:hypothetical protein